MAGPLFWPLQIIACSCWRGLYRSATHDLQRRPITLNHKPNLSFPPKRTAVRGKQGWRALLLVFARIGHAEAPPGPREARPEDKLRTRRGLLTTKSTKHTKRFCAHTWSG